MRILFTLLLIALAAGLVWLGVDAVRAELTRKDLAALQSELERAAARATSIQTELAGMSERAAAFDREDAARAATEAAITAARAEAATLENSIAEAKAAATAATAAAWRERDRLAAAAKGRELGELELADGRRFAAARVVAAADDSLQIAHENGIIRVPSALLPPALRRDLGHDVELPPRAP
jgi:hypothetical protein